MPALFHTIDQKLVNKYTFANKSKCVLSTVPANAFKVVQ